LGGMTPVATAVEVTIHCPSEGRYAFYNSPYPAHRLSTGIDVYPAAGFGDPAPSPVEGEVTLIRKVRAPRGRLFRDHGHDVVTLVRSRENPGRVVKVLHVEPTVEVGTELEPGSELGTLIRSGYFGFGTPPHLHVEVRRPTDPLRARGGCHLRRVLDVGGLRPLDELRGVVTESGPYRAYVRMLGASRYGVTADVGGVTGVLDGGIPNYGWVGAHFGSEQPREPSIRLCGMPIAEIEALHERTCTADCTDFTISLDGNPVGLFMYLYPEAEPRVILVPRVPGALGLRESDEIELRIE
jgi:hypothetical protein